MNDIPFKRRCKGLVDTGNILVECQQTPDNMEELCRDCLKRGVFLTVHARMVRVRGKFWGARVTDE